MRYNKKANRFRQMEFVRKAVSDSTGPNATFYLENRGNSADRTTAKFPTEPRTTIRALAVSLDDDDAKAHLGPDVRKIGMEGAELLALRGCSSRLKQHRPAIIVAIHPTWLPTGPKAAEVFEMFRDH